ncbi:hypothetical protein [Marinobacterium stanieri]|uniref:hypothetical protein n=1 Tax=Marinobacterium stanieri TaxID=49186 RepID=UPI0002558BEB|nr:hypothetical protein [Marinobacterium stanieri]
MRTNDNKTTGAEGIEIQVFPRGMWYVIGAVVCMAVSLAILLVMIAILISQLVSFQVVLVVSLCLFAFEAFSLVTPTFLLTRGGAKWHRFLKYLNLCVVGMLAIAGVVTLFVGSPNLVSVAVIGLCFSLVSGWLYRTGAHAECVEYYRSIWEYRRQHMQG